MAQEIILKISALGFGDADGKVSNLKKALKDMKSELMSLDEGSDRFKKISAAAAELQDHIGDVNDKVKALSSDTKRLDALVGAGSAIAGGFQAASGAMALFGSDSKQVEKAIQNIIAVQGILNGVQQVGQFLTAKGIIQDGLATAAMAVKSAAVKTATAAQWLWNAAVTANPIGIIVVGVAALTAGIYKLVDGLRKGTITIQDINKVLWRMIMPLQLIVDLYNYLTAAATETETTLQKNSRANTDRYNKEVEQIKEKRRVENEAFTERQTQFDLNIARLEAEGKSTKELTRQKLEAIVEEKKAALQMNIDLINALVKRYEIEAQLRGKSLEEFLKSVGINYEATRAQLEGHLQQQKDAIFSAETDLIAHNKETNKATVDNKKAANDEQLKLEQQRIKDEEDLQRKQIEDQRELKKNRDAYLLEQEQAQLDAEFDLLEAQIDRENAARELQAQQELDRRNAQFKIAQNFAKASIDLAQTIFTITNALGKQDEESRRKRAKRQFEINKSLAIADATISTINGVVNALSEKSILPAPLSTILKASNAVAVAAAGAANIAKIAGQKFDGGIASPTLGGGGDAGSAAGNVGNTTPNINPINSGSTLLNPESQKVYVVESDITKTQKKVHSIESLATFG